MANLQSMSQPARFWAFVQELETKGARPSETQSNDQLGNIHHQHPRQGLGRGGRGGRGGHTGGPRGRHARMQQAMAQMQATAHEVSEEPSSDEDGFTPIATPVESINEKDALRAMFEGDADNTEIKNKAGNQVRRGGMRGPGQPGRRGRGGPNGVLGAGRGAGLRGGFGGRGMHQDLMGCHGMPGARWGARGGQHGPNHLGPRRGIHGGPFRMGGMRRALFEESSSDERKERKPGMKRRGLAGPGAKQGNEQKPGAKKPFSPRVDIFESPTSYTVNVALPGAKRENIQLVWRCKRGVLVVKGRILRKTEDIKQSHTIAQRERAAGTFERRIALKFDSAADFKPASIAANLEDGVLRVDLSKEKTEKSFDGPWKINF